MHSLKLTPLVPLFLYAYATTALGTPISAQRRVCIQKIGGHTDSSLAGPSATATHLRSLIAASAPATVPVIIVGEDAIARDEVAHALWAKSAIPGPLVEVPLSYLNRTLASALFFGTEGNAGFLESADGGTLYLGEVADMPRKLQKQLHRFLDGNGFTKWGSSETLYPKVRVVCSSQYDLEDLVRHGLFDAGLYYRLNLLRIEVPPLKDRAMDIPFIAAQTLKEIHALSGRHEPRAFSAKAVAKLQRHSWPGNMAELRAVVRRAYIASHTTSISAEDIVFVSW